MNYEVLTNSIKRKKRSMSKKILLLLLLFSSICRGQDYYIPQTNHNYQPRQQNTYKDTNKKVSCFFSFDLGISQPLRDYGAKTTSNNFMIIGPDSTNGKGFANLGFHLSISGGIFITPNFGFCTKFTYNQNNFDADYLNLLTTGQCSYSILGDYGIYEFMGGGFGNFQLGKTTSIWVQGMVGLINANFPAFSIYNLPGYQYLSWNFNLTNSNAFVYSLSIGFEKGLSQNISLIGTVSYSGAELSFIQTYYYSGPYTNLPPPYTQATPVTMAFGSLDFSAGLLFHL